MGAGPIESGPMDRRQKINLAAALVCIGMVLWAIYYAQRVLGLEPCPLCMFQRVCIGALGIVFLVAALHPARRTGAIVYGVLIFLAAGATTWVAGRHVWIQSQPPGTVPSCGAPLDTLVEMFPLFEVVRRVMTGGGSSNGQFDYVSFGVFTGAKLVNIKAESTYTDRITGKAVVLPSPHSRISPGDIIVTNDPLLGLAVQTADCTPLLFVDPTRGAVVQRSESITRLRRWLYQGLHSLDFPFLYYKRPLWDIVVIVLSLGGLALSVTTLTPALRRLLRHMKARTAISGRLLVVVAGGGRKWFDRGEANPPPAGAP